MTMPKPAATPAPLRPRRLVPITVGIANPILTNALDADREAGISVYEFEEVLGEPKLLLEVREMDVDSVVSRGRSDYLRIRNGGSRLAIHRADLPDEASLFRTRVRADANSVAKLDGGLSLRKGRILGTTLRSQELTKALPEIHPLLPKAPGDQRFSLDLAQSLVVPAAIP
jgi:hypothetical protein